MQGKAVGRKNVNPARTEPVSEEVSRRIVLRETFKNVFESDYHQIVKRVSSGGEGLFWGSPNRRAT